MRRVVVTLALSLGLVVSVLTGTAFAAAAVIVSPAEGQVVAPGLRGITVDVTDGGSFSWTLADSDGDYYEEGYFTAGPGRLSVAVPVVDEPDSYTFNLQDDGGFTYEMVAFQVVTPPRLTSPTASPPTFYPVVRDGYRDHVTFAFRTATDLGRVDYEVRDSSYRVVARHSIGARGAGVVSWAWNGRDADGRALPTAAYTIKATARTAAEARTLTVVSPRFRSVTGMVEQRVQRVRLGDDTSSRARSGSCRADASGEDALLLVCRAAAGSTAYVRARYDFSLPAGATSPAWRATGEAGCCDEGVIRRTGVKVGTNGFRIEVHVSGRRSFRIDRATVAYTTSVRR